MRSTKSLADAIGLPDEQDKLRIKAYIAKYDREHPGEIASIIQWAKEQHQADPMNDNKSKFGEVNKAARGRVLFELPTEIGHWLGEAYPLMFRSKSHTQWFAKNFKELLIHGRY